MQNYPCAGRADAALSSDGKASRSVMFAPGWKFRELGTCPKCGYQLTNPGKDEIEAQQVKCVTKQTSSPWRPSEKPVGVNRWRSLRKR